MSVIRLYTLIVVCAKLIIKKLSFIIIIIIKKIIIYVSESFIAIPETINSSTISVVGEWDRFNVTWEPATRVNINNSHVYYDVNLHFSGLYKIEVRI